MTVNTTYYIEPVQPAIIKYQQSQNIKQLLAEIILRKLTEISTVKNAPYLNNTVKVIPFTEKNTQKKQKIKFLNQEKEKQQEIITQWQIQNID